MAIDEDHVVEHVDRFQAHQQRRVAVLLQHAGGEQRGLQAMRRAAPDHLPEAAQRVAVGLGVVRQPVEKALHRSGVRSRRISRRSAGVNWSKAWRATIVTNNHVNPNVCSCSRKPAQCNMAGAMYGAEGMGSGLARIVSLLAAPLALGGSIAAASAGECPGNPDALGTSRTIVVDPREHIRIGTMGYAETLPLADHEVVLTFDDGPIPPYTDKILDILAAECVKATYFIVGEHGEGISGAGAARL